MWTRTTEWVDWTRTRSAEIADEAIEWEYDGLAVAEAGHHARLRSPFGEYRRHGVQCAPDGMVDKRVRGSLAGKPRDDGLPFILIVALCVEELKDLFDVATADMKAKDAIDEMVKIIERKHRSSTNCPHYMVVGDHEEEYPDCLNSHCWGGPVRPWDMGDDAWEFPQACEWDGPCAMSQMNAPRGTSLEYGGKGEGGTSGKSSWGIGGREEERLELKRRTEVNPLGSVTAMGNQQTEAHREVSVER